MAADPFKNDVNFVLSVLSLEELGATGNKGLALLLDNPVHANAVAGLATSANSQATVEVHNCNVTMFTTQILRLLSSLSQCCAVCSHLCICPRCSVRASGQVDNCI